MNLLEVKNLNTSFHIGVGTVQAVRGISFHVAQGESLGIVGESGSGKSVTMLSVTGLLPYNAEISSDSITFDGREISGLSKKEMRKLHGSEIGMIFQDPMTSLNPLFTVENQLTEPLKIHRHMDKASAREKALALLRQVDIPNPEARLKQYPHELSGGLRQRVMIAIAIACAPKLIIADEPTTALDVTVQAQILELIRRLARENGTAVIMITHDLGVVASLCDRIAVLYGGKVCETGTADEIFYETKHPYTAGLLRSVSRRAASGGKTARGTLQSIPGTPPDLLHLGSGCPFAARCGEAMKICRDYYPAETAFGGEHSAACWLWCREKAAELTEAQDRERGERHG